MLSTRKRRPARVGIEPDPFRRLETRIDQHGPAHLDHGTLSRISRSSIEGPAAKNIAVKWD